MRKPLNIKIKHPGAFTRKAKAKKETVQQLAAEVLASGSKASAETKKQANFARNAAKWKHPGRKRAAKK